MTLVAIRQTGPETLTLTWDDGHASDFSFRLLRDECPCAECKGESVLLHTYPPAEQSQHPQRYALKGIQKVGSYAIQITWGDGHDTGLYAWEYLRAICPCAVCSAARLR